jgi:hypothetical protein
MTDAAAEMKSQHDRVIQLIQEADEIDGDTPPSLDEVFTALRGLTAMEAQVLYEVAGETLNDGAKLEQDAREQQAAFEDIVAELDDPNADAAAQEKGRAKLKRAVDDQAKVDDKILSRLHDELDEDAWSELGERLQVHRR